MNYYVYTDFQKLRVFLKGFFIFLCFVLFVNFTGLFAQGTSQKIGFKDVTFSSLSKPFCQDCHGENLVDTHHKTSPAVSGDCASCHNVSTEANNVGVALERDCMICHNKSPHHSTEAAINKECNSCHESPGISEYSMKVPSYQSSSITPTTNHCKNCHVSGDVEGLKVADIKSTHHGISLKGCNVCHDENDKSSSDIRTCERCHNVKAIHEILAHVEKDNCVKCHGGKIQTEPST